MKYEDALRKWGALKLEQYGSKVDPQTVTVVTNFSEGYPCCGGNNPGCYCSLATSPTATVMVSSYGFPYTYTIDLDEFDFVTFLGEIVDAADGTMTN